MQRASGHELAVERFDYSRVGDEWAVLRLLARLGSKLGAPADTGLVVRRGLATDDTVYPARACSYERRLLGIAAADSDNAGELLWRASFAVPLAVVEFQHALFELTAEGGIALGLPSPGIRVIDTQPLRLGAPRRRGYSPSRIGGSPNSHRLAALATLAVVTTTSTPAVALAATGMATGPARAAKTAAPAQAGSAERIKAAERLALALSREAAQKAATRAAAASTSSATSSTRASGTAKAGGAEKSGATPAVNVPTVSKQKATTPGKATIPGKTTARGKATTPGKAKPAALRPSRHSPARRHIPTIAVSHPMATIPPVARAKRDTSTIRHLTHPKLTHIFSAPAAPAPPTTPTPGPGTQPATGATGTTTTTGTTGVTTPTGTTGTGTTGTGTPPPKPPVKAPEGASGKVPGAATPGHLTAAPPTPLAKSPEQTSSRPGVQPLGGLSAKPPVKLASDGGVAPAGTVPTWSSTPGYNGPASWTGTVSTDPSLAGALSNLSNLLANGNQPPQFLIPIYMEAGRRYGIRWQVLAAINAVESDYGRDLSTSSAGALGWMQFEPSTWKQWGVAADGHSVPNPYDPRDAIFSAARYLAAAGGARDIGQAVFAYNHAGWYVDEVMARANAIATHALFARATVNRRGTFSVFFSTSQKRRPVIRYRGGLMSHYDRLIASANMVSAANFPYVYGGGHEQPARFGPFDCSGSVSYVMQQAGYKVPTTVSGDIPIWKFPAGPGRVTIFYNPGHTFMRIGNRYFGTSGIARPGGGAGWFDTNKLPAGYLAQFREVHVPRLGPNSFAPERLGSSSF